MRTLSFSLCLLSAAWCGATQCFAADDARSTDEAIAAFPAPQGEDEATYFSDTAINRLLTPEQPFEDPEVTLVQREEPVSGDTPEETVLRNRVQQAQQSYSGYGAQYSYRQPYAYGPNSLLPGYFGYGYGGVGTLGNTGKRLYVSVAQTADYVTNLALPLFVTPNNVLFQQRDDYQFQTNVFAQYRIFGNEKHSLTTAFNYYQSLHPEVQQLDLFAYSSLTQYTRAITNRLTAFVNFNYTYYLLDHNSFLSRNAVGSGLAWQGRCRTSWIGSFNVGQNLFRQDPTQSATTEFVQLQRVKYFGQANYWFGGYAYGNNNAQLNGWSYNLHSIFLGGGLRFGECKRNELFMLGSYGTYGFRGPDPLTVPATVRQDDVWTYTSRLSRSLSPHATVFAQYAWFNSNSNIARQNFGSNLYSVGAVIGW